MLQKEELLKKAYSVYNALKESERKILAGEEHWKADLQFMRFDWRQGVGYYGIWNLYKITKDKEILKFIEEWILRRIDEGQPNEKTINSVCPMLTVSHIYEETKDPKWLPLIEEWVEWIMSPKGLPKTKEGAFDHYCGVNSPNTNQLWDDTLFMTVLFLAKAGVLLNKKEYTNEAARQFIIHAKYLTDSKTGLWYHVYDVKANKKFAGALWGRGNSWVTASIPEFLEITNLDDGCSLVIKEIFKLQAQALKKYQDKNTGLYHTLVNKKDSYLETTATAGFTFGLMKAKRFGIIGKEYAKTIEKGFLAIVDKIDERGYLTGASDGTPLGQDLAFYYNVPLNTRAYAQGLSLLLLTEAIKNLK